MKIKLISGKIVNNVKIKKAPARLERAYGYKKMAYWEENGAPCSVPVEKNNNNQYIKII